MKKANYLVEEGILIEALKRYGKGAGSKDYEFFASIYMKRKLEQSYGEPFTIAFETNVHNTDVRPYFQATPEQVNEVIRNKLEENTPMDFGLVKGTIQQHDSEGFAFQVKRFIVSSPVDITEELADFVNELLKVHAAGEVNLLVVPSPSLNPRATNVSNFYFLDFNRLKGLISPLGRSFLAVFVLAFNGGPIIKRVA